MSANWRGCEDDFGEGNGWDRYRLANPAYFDDYVRHGFPMGRLGTAEEVADVIVFIASPRAHWINGRNNSGGWSGAAARADRPPAVLGLIAGIRVIENDRYVLSPRILSAKN